MSLEAGLSGPAAKRQYVRRLFATIADRYDLITVVLSYGLDRRWKRRLVAMAAAGAQTRCLDLACGTGDLTFGLAARGARAVGLDVTPRMIALARQKSAGPRPGSAPAWLVGDMMALPFADESFDVVTTGYGIRNVPVIEPALAEIRRVLRPGGRLLSLDFNRPEHALVRAVYLGYLTAVGGTLGWLLHRDPDTYRYIPESIRRYPGARGLAVLMRDAGFADARHQDLLGGLMAINTARRPP